jgi:hypothetical protein
MKLFTFQSEGDNDIAPSLQFAPILADTAWRAKCKADTVPEITAREIVLHSDHPASPERILKAHAVCV